MVQFQNFSRYIMQIASRAEQPDISKKFTSECYYYCRTFCGLSPEKCTYFVLGQNGLWQNIMHIYVYEDDEEQGGGALSKPGQWPQ